MTDVTAPAAAPEEGVALKPKTRWIATSGTFPGYWGAHADGPHHAIVECISAGAHRDGIFVVYEAYDGCYIDEWGSSTYLEAHGNPFDKPEGVFDATGEWLGENLAEVARDCQTKDWWVAEHPIFSKETIASLKKHKA